MAMHRCNGNIAGGEISILIPHTHTMYGGFHPYTIKLDKKYKKLSGKISPVLGTGWNQVILMKNSGVSTCAKARSNLKNSGESGNNANRHIVGCTTGNLTYVYSSNSSSGVSNLIPNDVDLTDAEFLIIGSSVYGNGGNINITIT